MKASTHSIPSFRMNFFLNSTHTPDDVVHDYCCVHLYRCVLQYAELLGGVEGVPPRYRR